MRLLGNNYSPFVPLLHFRHIDDELKNWVRWIALRGGHLEYDRQKREVDPQEIGHTMDRAVELWFLPLCYHTNLCVYVYVPSGLKRYRRGFVNCPLTFLPLPGCLSSLWQSLFNSNTKLRLSRTRHQVSVSSHFLSLFSTTLQTISYCAYEFV